MAFIYSNILPFLKWNHLLKFRQVSREMQTLVDSFIIKEFGGVPSRIEIEINERKRTWKEIETFLQLNYPATSFYLNNPSGHSFFEDDKYRVSRFIQLYGPQITRLHVHRISAFPSRKELEFYESLKSLTNLQIDSVFLGQTEKSSRRSTTTCWNMVPNPFASDRRQLNERNVDLPSTFENLKVLKINQDHQKTKKKPVPELALLIYNIAFLSKCSKLDYLALGLTSNIASYNAALNLCFNLVIYHMKTRAISRPLESNLKVFDFKNFSHIHHNILRTISPNFLEMCRVFSNHQVKIRNVQANLFKAFHPQYHQDRIISSVIESMEGLHPSVLSVELPHLTSLFVVTLFQTSFRGGQLPYRTSWPVLEHLGLIINTTNLWGCTRQGQKIPAMPVTELLDLLLGNGVDRKTMKTLRLHFSSRMLDTLSNDVTVFPCPRVADIVSSCPNLTKLELINWPNGDNLTLSKLWAGLVSLEEVRLTKCKLLGDEAFIGVDEDQPAFLRLKRLKKLWLVDLEKMPMITDKSFSLVFRQMKLSEFVLYSEKPLKNITREGISSLFTGDFATSIEKFPFGCWSLADVNKDQWKMLQTLFH